MTQTTHTQTVIRTHIAIIARFAAVLLAGALAGILAAPGASHGATVTLTTSTLCKLVSPSINESSGVVVSGNIYFTHNDGPVNKFYAVDAAGRTLATFATPGVPTTRSDWEDMAAGTDSAGKPALFFGDIGDNARSRPEIAVIRVTRPAVDTAKLGVTATAAGITRYRFAYPDGAKDAESLAVQPGTNRIIIVSKAAGGAVYAAPLNPSITAVNKLTKIGTVSIPGATGAAFSSDGTKFVVRQYKNAAIYKVTGNDLAAATKTAPLAIAMPSQRQGEAVTFGAKGGTLVLTSEGQYSPVLTQTLPA
jgi:hypothetical protein